MTRKIYSAAFAGTLAACLAVPAAAADQPSNSDIATSATVAPYPTPVPRSQIQPVVIHGPNGANRGSAAAVPALIRAPQGKIGTAPQLQLLRNEFITGGQNGKAAPHKINQVGAR